MIHRSMRVVVLALLAVGCAARGGSEGGPKYAVRTVEATDIAAYGRAETLEQLAVLVERDIGARDFEAVDRGVGEFVRSSVLAGNEMRGHLLLSKLRPAWRLQGVGGERYVGSVTERARVLELASRQDLRRAHAALERGDWQRLREMRADASSTLGADVLALSDALKPHADLVDALLRYEALRSSALREPGEARAITAALERVAPALERDGFGELSFVARFGAAEVLDLAGLTAEAIERWLSLVESRYLASADESVQMAIAIRLKAYTDRLREDLTAQIRAQEQERADERVTVAEAKFKRISDEQRARAESLEREIEQVRAEAQLEIRRQLTDQRALFADTLERQQQRIRELEQLFAQIAIAREQGSDAYKAIDLTADLVTIWSAVHRRRAAL